MYVLVSLLREGHLILRRIGRLSKIPRRYQGSRQGSEKARMNEMRGEKIRNKFHASLLEPTD